MRIDQPVYSVLRWPGLRSEFSWLPPDGGITTTAPNQIGASFSAHDRVGHEGSGRARYVDIPPGAVFANGSYEVLWTDVRQPTEALETYPDADQLAGWISSTRWRAPTRRSWRSPRCSSARTY